MTKVLIIGQSGAGKIYEAIEKLNEGVEILIVASEDELMTKKLEPIITEDKYVIKLQIDYTTYLKPA